ncbi:MAG: hypothetical protein AAGA87_12445 [Pseudomonadota bacterium]
MTKMAFRDAVRKRPGMYIGDPERAATHMVLELVANGIEEVLRGNATRVSVDV